MARRIIDLSYTIHEGMTTYPVHWHPVVEITQLGRHGIENRESRKLVLGTHTGTHMDAPLHFIRNGAPIDQIPLHLLVGPARLVDFSNAKPKQEIGVDDFKRALGREKPERLVMRFDWSRFWGTMEYYAKQPFISEEAGQWLIDRGVRLLGMDTAQADSPDNGRNGPKDSPIHKIMLGQGCWFVEYMTNLKELRTTAFELYALPLNILGADGAPARCLGVVS
jgi:kynurenine formamidase